MRTRLAQAAAIVVVLISAQLLLAALTTNPAILITGFTMLDLIALYCSVAIVRRSRTPWRKIR